MDLMSGERMRGYTNIPQSHGKVITCDNIAVIGTVLCIEDRIRDLTEIGFLRCTACFEDGSGVPVNKCAFSKITLSDDTFR